MPDVGLADPLQSSAFDQLDDPQEAGLNILRLGFQLARTAASRKSTVHLTWPAYCKYAIDAVFDAALLDRVPKLSYAPPGCAPP
jgi:hypothetical protein